MADSDAHIRNTGASSPTFTPFPRLPYELRRQIYLLATPHRIVHVQERFPGFPSYKAAYDAFYKRHRSERIEQDSDLSFRRASVECSDDPEAQEAQDKQLDPYFEPTWVKDGLHQDIAYFAHFWRQSNDRHGDARLGSHARIARRIGRLPPFPGALMSRKPPPYISDRRIEDPDWDNGFSIYGVEAGIPGKAATEELAKQDEKDFMGLPEQLRPWTPTPAVPEFPLWWLYHFNYSAWEFQRQPELFSRAPIPRFLHVCRESREVLRDTGYELAFGSRLTDKRAKGEEEGEHGGMTWFNFAKDILYVGDVEHDFPVDDPSSRARTNRPYPLRVCQNLSWDVSVFLARDLKRVTRLALPQSSCFVRCIGFDPKMHAQLVNLIRCFPALDELLMADWAHLKEEAICGVEQEGEDYDEEAERREAVRMDRLSKDAEAWFYLPVQEVDVFSPSVLKRWQGDFWTAVGEGITGIKAFWAVNKDYEATYANGSIGGGERRENYPDGRTLPRDWFERLAMELQIDFATIAREAPDSGLPPLGMKSFPKVSLVHIGTAEMLDALTDERRKTWELLLQGETHDTGEYVSLVDGQLLVPPRWMPDCGWTLDKIHPFEDEGYEWSVSEVGLQKKSDPVENIPRRTKTWR